MMNGCFLLNDVFSSKEIKAYISNLLQLTTDLFFILSSTVCMSDLALFYQCPTGLKNGNESGIERFIGNSLRAEFHFQGLILRECFCLRKRDFACALAFR